MRQSKTGWKTEAGMSETSRSDNGAGAATAELPPEELKRRAEIGKRLAGAFGEIVSVMMRSEAHRLTHIAELEWLVLPAIATAQFSIADAQSRTLGVTAPIGVVLWASVSDEIDRRLSSNLMRPARLKPEDWKSGDTIWIIEAIGDPRALDSMFKAIAQREWKGRAVKMRTMDEQGRPVVKTLA
jgi:hemolysin-activating ACP:hemolysin acyltransferase